MVQAYQLIKPELLNLILLRKTNDEIAKHFDINYKLASKWRNKLYREMGELNDDKMKTMRREFLTRKKQEMDIAVLKIFRALSTSELKEIPSIVNAWTNLTKTELDIYSRFGVLSPEKFEHQVNANQEVTFKNFEEAFEKYYGENGNSGNSNKGTEDKLPNKATV